MQSIVYVLRILVNILKNLKLGNGAQHSKE